jgi:hypothetical protein
MKHVEQFPDINKQCNVASCWIYSYIGIPLGARPILHISRIRVNSRITAACNIHLTTNYLKTDGYLNCIQNFSSFGTENTIVTHYKNNKSREFFYVFAAEQLKITFCGNTTHDSG